MGHLWLQVLPHAPGDHRRELQIAVMRHRLEKYPNDFSAHLNLGAILMSQLESAGGYPHVGSGSAYRPYAA